MSVDVVLSESSDVSIDSSQRWVIQGGLLATSADIVLSSSRLTVACRAPDEAALLIPVARLSILAASRSRRVGTATSVFKVLVSKVNGVPGSWTHQGSVSIRLVSQSCN